MLCGDLSRTTASGNGCCSAICCALFPDPADDVNEADQPEAARTKLITSRLTHDAPEPSHSSTSAKVRGRSFRAASD
jgi:hypothetical protein